MSNEEISNLAEELNKSDTEVQEKYDQDLINENETLIKVALPYMIKFYQVAQTAFP